MEDDDLEMLRQAALRSMGSNRNRQKENTNQSRGGSASRIKTNGNLIEIQPSDDLSDVTSREELNSEDYVVEEFVLDGSDISINSSDCDEVIEEVIVSDPDEVENDAMEDGDHQRSNNSRDQNQEKRSPSRSLSSHRQNSSDDEESDAVSIQSSYSLIMDDDEEFQSVEAKFLSRKLQKQKLPTDSANSTTNEETSSHRIKSRSPLPFRTSRATIRRSRSRERDVNRSTNRKSRSRSRSPPPPVRRRNHSPSSRGVRRPYRTNSSDRSQRRRRSRSRSISNRSPPPSNRSKFGSQNSRRPKSRSKSPVVVDKLKQRSTSNSQSGAPKSPADDKLPEKIQKTVKNNHIPPEQLERLEKRRRKFEGESELVAPKKKVIKIASDVSSHLNKDKQSSTTSQSQKQPSSSGKSPVLKEKTQKTSKRSVELVKESDLTSVKSSEKTSSRHTNDETKDKSSGGDNQEDLRTRLIKKKMEKQMQQGSGSSSSGSSNSTVPLSSVVVPVNNKGSHRIFSQALKNSQLLDSVSELSTSTGSSKGSSSSKSKNKETSSSSSSGASTKIHKPKSEVIISRNISSNSGSSSGNKKLSSSSRRGASSSSSLSSSKTKSSSSSTSSGTKRVVSVTYS